ncbi:DUF2461 domain-containing protein [[Clostridium] hylemonae]|uniref:TIGR02453 family protein n=1 Tax=[Clostridium] hylemonae DSM 15053 TaxID=553973 RepID=C0C4Z6_9FIRM|nr:DUF2461 domain-containing protein [[Clostridium] hylemonae]EEG72764.1 TIGR02453 family protein [[Clostridium] hylemonae DSM 15053]QEK16126.1 hypothetical protein LAJLEIBI_00105 [[Clostridium] hylemonae DSM 15053]
MNLQMILEYLNRLKENNNREWYHEHKPEYEAAAGEFLKLVEALMMELGKEEPGILRHEPKKLTYKLVRDTRFSKDKSPYNPAFRVHLSEGGKQPVPAGYYLMLTPGGSFLGGGLFADIFKEETGMMRDYIAAHGEEWEAVIRDESFSSLFEVKGTALKNVPAGYDREHPQAQYLKNKSWYVEYPLADEALADADRFISETVEVCRIIKPFNEFINKALAGSPFLRQS